MSKEVKDATRWRWGGERFPHRESQRTGPAVEEHVSDSGNGQETDGAEIELARGPGGGDKVQLEDAGVRSGGQVRFDFDQE